MNKREGKRFPEYCVPLSFMDEQCLNWLISQFKKGKFNKKVTWSFIHDMSRMKKEYHDVFYENVNEISNNQFIYPKPTWEQTDDEIKRLKYEALLDKTKYIQYIQNAFKIIGKIVFQKKI